MIITHNHKEWLDTNPSFTEFKKSVRATFKGAYQCIERIQRILKRVKTRSCISGKLVKRPLYPASRKKVIDNWMADIKVELTRTTRYIANLEAFERIAEQKWGEAIYRDRHRRLAEWIAYEIAKEEVVVEALEILNSKR